MTTGAQEVTSRRKLLFYGVVAATCLLRIEYEVRYNDYGPDESLQLCAAKNVQEGNGICRCDVDPTDLSIDTYTKLTVWPYGYPLIVSLASMLTHDLLRASVPVDTAA
jgi:hypothetical protein